MKWLFSIQITQWCLLIQLGSGDCVIQWIKNIHRFPQIFDLLIFILSVYFYFTLICLEKYQILNKTNRETDRPGGQWITGLNETEREQRYFNIWLFFDWLSALHTQNLLHCGETKESWNRFQNDKMYPAGGEGTVISEVWLVILLL